LKETLPVSKLKFIVCWINIMLGVLYCLFHIICLFL